MYNFQCQSVNAVTFSLGERMVKDIHPVCHVIITLFSCMYCDLWCVHSEYLGLAVQSWPTICLPYMFPKTCPMSIMSLRCRGCW